MKFLIIYVISACTLTAGILVRQKFHEYHEWTVGKLVKLQDPKDDEIIQIKNNKTFRQKVDHFDPTNREEWNQRYWCIDQYYEKGGPIFLFIEGEGPARPNRLSQSTWGHYVVKYKALAFVIEHRYYGKSNPKWPLTTENLKYLNSKQALADYAYFIGKMNALHKLPESSRKKWITFGGSYSGMLSAWTRMNYPHLVYAAYSSSAPILAKSEFKEYLQVVKKVLANYKPECITEIRKATKKLTKMVKTTKGKKKIKKMFNLCSELKTSEDIETYFLSMADLFSFAVQYNNDNTRPYVKDMCDRMTNSEKKDAVKKYADAVDYMNRYTLGMDCLDASYESYIRNMQKTDDENNNYRTWMYQTCTEFGFYQTILKSTELFGPQIGLKYFVKSCKDSYGEKFNGELLDEVVEWTNIRYGELKFNTSNVLFIHGSADPWHPLGIYHRNKKILPEVVYLNGSHCADIRFDSVSKYKNNIEGEKKVRKIVDSWMH